MIAVDDFPKEGKEDDSKGSIVLIKRYKKRKGNDSRQLYDSNKQLEEDSGSMQSTILV